MHIDKKEVIYTFKAGDWFNKIPFHVLCDGGLTAINVDRRYGKTTFIVDAIKEILDKNMADLINVYCIGRSHADFINLVIKERLGENFEGKERLQILAGNTSMMFCCSDKRRTVNFVDEDVCSSRNICGAIKSELANDADTWVFLGTSYDHGSGATKNPFAGLLEMPFVRSYEVVGKLPKEAELYLPEETKKAIERRKEMFPAAYMDVYTNFGDK